MFKGVKKAVFVCAHCDDEQVCAGTLHRLVRSGVTVHVLSATTAALQTTLIGVEDYDDVNKNEWRESMKIIGAVGWIYGIYPSSDFYPHRQKLCQWVYGYLVREEYDLAIILSPEDENPAHKIMGEECERVMRGRVPTVLRCQFPWNYSSGRGNVFVELSPGDLEAKEKVCLAYKSQSFRYNYREIFMSQARMEGLSVKVPYAEKFELLRAVI